jgi:hypothetical protein
MSNPQFPNEAVAVSAIIDEQGQVQPQTVTMRGVSHTVVTVGRQWEDESGRHVLVEVGDGSRYELSLSRAKLVWLVTRIWPAVLAA